jgi:glycosyltransferase involved in cell wall biosynthesis
LSVSIGTEAPVRVAYDARHAARGLGISTFLVHLAQELVALGSVELIWLGDPALAPAGVTSFARPDRLPYPVLDGPLGRVLAGRLRADVMHFAGNTGWAKPGPVPAVLTLHDLIFLSGSVHGRSARQIVGHRYERWLLMRAVSAATVVAVPTQTVAREVRARLGTATDPHVVYEGVSPPARVAGYVSREPLGAPHGRTGAPRRPYLVAFAGRDPRKRTAAIVDAWRSVASLGIDLRLLASGGLAPELRASLTPEVALGNVEILDHLPRPDLWEVIAGALALAYPSSNEGFGLPVLEAMAAGTPVLSGLAPATREVGGDAIIGLDERDVPGSIAAAVTRLYEDRDFAEAVSLVGRAHAARFSWRATAEHYLELYRLARERRPR